MRKKPPPNLPARFLARIARAARKGEIIGFAATLLTRTGGIETWYVPDDENPRWLAGEVHMLNQKVAWMAGGPQAVRSEPFPVPKRKVPKRK